MQSIFNCPEYETCCTSKLALPFLLLCREIEFRSTDLVFMEFSPQQILYLTFPEKLTELPALLHVMRVLSPSHVNIVVKVRHSLPAKILTSSFILTNFIVSSKREMACFVVSFFQHYYYTHEELLLEADILRNFPTKIYFSK